MITLVSAGSKGQGATSVTYALPGGGITAGDLFVLFVETANEAVTGPAGWTAVPNSPQGTGVAADPAATRLTAFYHVYNGTAPSTTVTMASSDHQMGAIMAYRGVDPAIPINATAGTVDASTDTTIDWPSVTTTVPNCRVLLAEAHTLPDSNTNGNTSGQTNANLTGLTEGVDYNSAQGNGGGFSVASGIKATAGATGASTGTAATATTKGLLVIALAPLISGSLAATGPSTGTAAISGSVRVSGALAATGASTDTAALRGFNNPIRAIVSAIEAGLDALRFAGLVPPIFFGRGRVARTPRKSRTARRR